MSSTQALSEILTNNTKLTNRTNRVKTTITNRDKPQTNTIVDQMLEQYKELIDPAYKKWFAGKFYNIRFDMVHRAASEARQEGRDPKRLFAYKIAQYAN